MNLFWLIQGNHINLNDANKSNLASIRMRAALTYNIKHKNIYTELFKDNTKINRDTVIGIGKLSQIDNDFIKWQSLAQYTISVGGKVFIDYTDNHLISSSPLFLKYKSLIRHCTHAVTSSDYLSRSIAEYFNGHISLIEDPIEIDPIPPVLKSNEVLTGLWFGHASNINFLFNYLIEMCNPKRKMKIIIMSNFNSEIINFISKLIHIIPTQVEIKLIEWSIKNMLDAASLSDFVILPTDPNDPRKAGVSSNRLVTALSLGLPCFADIAESYKEYANFTIPLERVSTLDFPFDKEILSKITLFQKTESPKYSKEAITKKWEVFLMNLLPN